VGDPRTVRGSIQSNEGGDPLDIVLKLRELRRLRGLSQEEAAASAGIGVKSLSSFETGERAGSMKLSQLLQLLAAYDVTPAEFFGAAVERAVFGELERLNPEETGLVAAFRALSAPSRALTLNFIAMVETVPATEAPARLRAVR
jgi:transcriptional regulator with XRE-family HTH domain